MKKKECKKRTLKKCVYECEDTTEKVLRKIMTTNIK